MDFKFLFCTILIGLHIQLTTSQSPCGNTWIKPYFKVVIDDKISETSTEEDCAVQFEFEEEVSDFKIGNFPTAINGNKPKLLGGTEYFEVREEGTDFILYIKSPIDYDTLEEGKKEVRFRILSNVESVEFLFNIININDNPVKIEPNNNCLVEENLEGRTPCTYTITDEDGIDETLDITEISIHKEYFIFKWDGEYIGKKSATATLHTKQELDYETNQMFVFDWTIKDDQDQATIRIIVTLVDLPDTKPQWITIFSQAQFDEKTNQTFDVSAIDGDYGVDDDIIFSCPKETMTEQLWDKLTCEAGLKRNEGIIKVEPINRDEDGINTFKFVINACELTLPDECTPQDIVLMIDDLNDNEPNITLSTNKITIDENKFTNLKEIIEITIEDKDLGENGQYEVTLSSNINNPDIDINDIFQTIPDTGYQKTYFQLIIINATLLDFDRTTDMHNFKLTLTAQEIDKNKDPQSADIEITLKNWNDELPEFTNSTYEVEIKETFGRCEVEELKIKDLYATDIDIGDRVSYELLGTDIKRRLEISGENEKLTLKTLHGNEDGNCDIQVFDYEKQGESISFQIQASDNFPPEVHKTYGEVIIKIIDVNDETPYIEVNPSSIELEENQKDGAKINVIITGSDPDTQPELKFDIDWKKSWATKSGQRKEIVKGFVRIEANATNAELFIVDIDKDNTPDYEKFDTINLYVYVEDIAQTIEGVSNRADAILIINVKDINDNEPEFNQGDIESPKKVKENSENGTLIVSVIATDKDVGTNLTYSLNARKGTADLKDGLVTIDDKGQISVDESEGIDAENYDDDGFIYELYYYVCANDSYFETCKEIYIVVEDVNDEIPTFIEEPKDITELQENAEIGQLVYEVKAHDGDRDDPNNVIEYIMSSTPSNNFIGIDPETGIITVIKEGLDREGEPLYEITLTIHDTPVNFKEQLSSVTKFKIKLKDQNDNCPVFEKEEIVVSENTNAGKEIGKFRVTDEDEPGNDNSNIEMTLEDVYSEGNGNRILKKEDFELTFAQTNQGNKAMATGTIKTKKLLRKFYGTHKLLIQAKDKGPEGEGPECYHTVRENVTLHIEKYSFDPPKFIFPQDDTIYVKHDQDLNTVLKDQGGNDIRNIEAYDADDKDKFNIQFSISDKNDGSTYFTILPKGKTQGELQLIARPNENLPYEIEIIATNDDQRPQATTKPVKIFFFDQDGQPVFNEDEINLKFKEDEEGVGIPQKTSQARFEGPEGSELPIYYLIHQNIHSAFECDISTGEIQLITPLYLENTTETSLILRASSTSQAIGQPEPRSSLKINIELIDVNNHEPEFDEENYAYGILNEVTKTSYVIKGSDLDPLDNLTYYIKDGSYQANGSGLSTDLTFDFKTDANRHCQIVPTFEVKADMDGYFLFDLIVDDSVHTAEAHVRVYIISELHLVEIKFENAISDIEDNKEEIQKIFSEALENSCVIHKIEKATEEGVDVDHTTKIITYCIDPRRNVPITKDAFQTSLRNYKVYRQLKTALGKVGNGLSLLNVDIPTVVENIEDELWAWLISVSVVLGTLCLLLIIAFILKNRSWTQRLNKLSTVKFHSQESNMNVAAPPTTNRRAVEGSNPIFNTSSYDDKQISSFDAESISSGESDLYGVENNPAFTMENFTK